MRSKDKGWRNSSPTSMLLIVVFLMTSESSHAQKATVTQPPPLYLNGQLCCPSGHYYAPDGCSPLANNTVFNPPIQNNTDLVSPDDITWEHRPLECPSGYEAKIYSLNNRPNALYLEEDGLYLDWWELLISTTKDFCVGLLSSGEYVGVRCHPNMKTLCAGATCVQKCCGDGEVVALDRGRCSIGRPINTTEFAFKFQSINGIIRPEPRDLQILHQTPVCSGSTLLLTPELDIDQRFYLLPNGFLYQPVDQKTSKENEFCLDHFFSSNGLAGAEPAAFYCGGPGVPTETPLKLYFYAVGVMISAIFLLVIILFHIFIPKLRDTPGICLLCHMISLFVAEIGLFIGYLFSNDIHRRHCVINGFITQYSLLAAFFWLNVMCYDIWRVIRATLQVIPLASIQANDSKKLKIFCAYAWGGPLVFTLATIILHNLPEDPDQTLLRPGFGVISCWFSGDYERLTFFYGVIAVLFVGNMIFLGHTIAMLHEAGAAFQCCRKTRIVSSCSRTHLDAFWMRFSLFTLMALCWVTEILSWKIPPENLWIPTDIINTLQGFFVFVIFIWSKKKRDIVMEVLTRTGSRVSDTVRKISRTDDTGVQWHASMSTSSTYGTQSHSNDAVDAVEQN